MSYTRNKTTTKRINYMTKNGSHFEGPSHRGKPEVMAPVLVKEGEDYKDQKAQFELRRFRLAGLVYVEVE